MIKNILIIEDNPSDIKYYQALFAPEREVSFLFLTRNKGYGKEKLKELIELLYGEIFLKIKNYFVYTKETIREFLKDDPFDFYIIDSLEDFAKSLVTETDLLKEKIAFMSSRKSFRESIQSEGCRVYSKNNIDGLIKECF